MPNRVDHGKLKRRDARNEAAAAERGAPSLKGSAPPLKKQVREIVALAAELGEDVPELRTRNAADLWLKKARVRATLGRRDRSDG